MFAMENLDAWLVYAGIPVFLLVVGLLHGLAEDATRRGNGKWEARLGGVWLVISAVLFFGLIWALLWGFWAEEFKNPPSRYDGCDVGDMCDENYPSM